MMLEKKNAVKSGETFEYGDGKVAEKEYGLKVINFMKPNINLKKMLKDLRGKGMEI